MQLVCAILELNIPVADDAAYGGPDGELATPMTIELKRAYDRAAESDGYRVLVDRIWPRGLAKADLQVDAWLKELAPSAGLRKWFRHDPAKWDEFKKRYARELEQHSDALEQLVERAKAGRVTLVFSAKDTEHNNAIALKQQLERRLNKSVSRVSFRRLGARRRQ
jgi:uncharacterized protein YeaO (DUF488 family)